MTTSSRSLIVLLLLIAASTVIAMRVLDRMERPIESPLATESAANSGAGSSDQPAEPAEIPGYDPPPFDNFAEALDRPLFSLDRRPSDNEPVATGVADGEPLTATLHGILFASSGSVALLTAVGDTTPVRILQGQVFQGWKLIEIHADSVVFERDEETVTLELIYRSQPAESEPRRTRRLQ